MTTRSLGAIAGIAGTIALLLCGRTAAQQISPIDATFVRPDGKPLKLSDYRGKSSIVLLFTRGFTGDFACFYCGVQTRAYDAKYKELHAAGAEVIMVLPGTRDVAGYVKKVGESNEDAPDPKYHVAFQVVGDPDFEATKAFGVPVDPSSPLPVSQPATIVVDRTGRVVFEHHGKNPSDRPKVEVVLALLKGQGATATAAAESKPTSAPAAASLPWLDYDVALKRAKEQHLPLLVEFYADWCGNCHQMEVLTYPNQDVRATLAGFVVTRVEFDHRKDLVTASNVKQLPDLRFFDPDGKELAKLVGFNGPRVVIATARNVIAKISGVETTAAVPETRARRVPVPATAEAIKAAIARGATYLSSHWRAASTAPAGYSPEDMVWLALLAAGRKPGDDADVRAVTDAACAKPLAGTYQTAFRALALARAGSAEDRALLEACLKFLIQSQLSNGQWTYSPPPPGSPPPAIGDNSNTAYGLLGLAACRRAGLDVPKDVVQRAEGAWLRSQGSDGGWGYRTDRETESYASMTESGLSSLLLCRKMLPAAAAPAGDRAISVATAWLTENFSVAENRKSGVQQGRLLYHLFALERCGALLGSAALAGHDWYQEGASFLLGQQADDGSWDDGADTPIAGTSFALLFLARSSIVDLGSR